MISLRHLWWREKQAPQKPWSDKDSEECANCGCPLGHMCHSPMFGCPGFEPIEED